MTRVEWGYGALSASYNMSWAFIAPVYPLFLLDAGLDLFEINLVLATYFVTSFVFEVPTGAVADVFGRRVSFLASCGVRAGAFTLYFFADTLVVFLVAEAIDAIGHTLASGALDAWAVDETRRAGGPVRSDRLLARGFAAASAAMIVSGLVGAHLAGVSLRIPWLAGAVGFVWTAAVAARVMRETPPARSSGPREAGRSARARVGRQLGRGLRTVRRSPLLIGLVVLTAASGFAQMPVLHYWPVKLEAASGMGTWVLGWAWVLFAVLGVVGSQIAPRLSARWGRGAVASGAQLLRGCAIAMAARAQGFGVTLGGVGGHSVGMAMTIPLVAAWVSDHADEEDRATVLSVSAAAFTLGGAAGLVGLGLVARAAGIEAAWGCAALVFGGCAIGFAFVGRLRRAETGDDG